MTQVYLVAGISRQALHKYTNREARQMEQNRHVLDKAREVRKEHPKMGCRKMYLLMDQVHLGRDKVEALLLSEGYRVKYRSFYKRTTYSMKEGYYPNLIEGLTLDGINQVWQTDITYFYAQGRFYFLTFIIDVYSRKVVGYHAGENLRAESNVEALKQAFAQRKGEDLSMLIHHSDRGCQYTSKVYKQMLKKRSISISMCLSGWQNAYGERINGTIKNEYLKERTIHGLSSLRKELKRAVGSYNATRPHWNLKGNQSPDKFEKELLDLRPQNKPKVILYTETAFKMEGASSPNHFTPELPQAHHCQKL